jgi:hypothetical protein
MIVAVADRLRIPVIVVVHSVEFYPTSHQREVFQRTVRRAAAVVTTSPTARSHLISRYDTAAATVVVISHGALADRQRRLCTRPVAYDPHMGTAWPRQWH